MKCPLFSGEDGHIKPRIDPACADDEAESPVDGHAIEL
jgi:hypothetical protein